MLLVCAAAPQVKAANAERRKQKVPKHVKKKAVSKNKKK